MNLVKEVEGIFQLRFNMEHTFFKRFFNKKISDKSLCQTHIITMMILKFEGSMPMSGVSERLNLEKGSFTPVANRLISLGYIEKHRDEKDKRVYKLSLTDKGMTYATQFSKEHHEFIESLFAEFSDIEVKAYFDAIETVVKMTERIELGLK